MIKKPRYPATERVRYFAPSQGYFLIPSENQDYKLSDVLIASMTQDNLAKCSSRDGFHAVSMPEDFNIFSAMQKLSNKGGDVEKARNFVKTAMRNNWLQTLTRLNYSQRKNEAIIHNYKTNHQETKRARLVGLDGDVSEVLSLKAALALTGKRPDEINEIMQYLNQTNCYIFRLNKRPKEKYEAVAWFYANSVGAVLDCEWNPSSTYSSLGVSFARAKNFRGLK